jgi:hypothetical protein
MDEKKKAHFLMGGALSLLVLDVVLARRFLFKSLWRSIYVSAAFWLVMHVPQVPAALRKCRPMGIPDTRIAVMTSIFGATWWKHAAKGVLR